MVLLRDPQEMFKILSHLKKLILPPSPETVAYDGPERRNQPTPALSSFSFLKGRRRSVTPDSEEAYVDLYQARLACLLLIFFIFTVVDSVSTLVYLKKGGYEVNPIARWMIAQGDDFFLLTKGIISGICILFVLIHKNFKYSRIAIVIGFLFYAALTAYHIILQINAL